MIKIFKRIILFFSIITFLCFIALGTFLFCTLKDVSVPSFSSPRDIKYSFILDEQENVVEDFSFSTSEYVKYDELPNCLINALLAIEDNEYFYHNGFNPRRIITAFINNIDPSNWTQGGSTLTQQLVKNTVLSNEKTLTRKIKEAYISYLLEKKLSKEEILEAFFNHIYFDESIPGIRYASKHFFSKDVTCLNYIESAFLVGLIKSPSSYHPIRHSDKLETRKNIVLKAMKDNNVITEEEYTYGVNIPITSLINKSEENVSYSYQAYLDVVYKEVYELTGLDLFLIPLRVDTYLDTSVQNVIDNIQNDNLNIINDDLLSIGGVVTKNNDSSICGIIGGRNYNGKKLFNNAYDLKVNPASTFKPVFPYILAMEYLNYNSQTILDDSSYNYSSTNISVTNADKRYIGSLSLEEALGYSRNTTAVKTLDLLRNKLGDKQLISYLKNINLYDDGVFSSSYALGGMTYGVSPINLSGAYALLANKGKYNKPTTIKKITRLDTEEVLYERHLENKQVISEESASMMVNTLTKVIDRNYYSISEAKPGNIKIGGKTGTNPYDSSVCKKYNYPLACDKDIWFCGFSPSFTISIWTGYTTPSNNTKAYFQKGSSSRKCAKKIFKLLMNEASKKNESFSYSSSVEFVNVVKGTGGKYTPNNLIDSFYVESILLPINQPLTILPYPKFSSINNVNILLYDNKLTLVFIDDIDVDELYESIFGKEGYIIKITSPKGEVNIVFTLEDNYTYPLSLKGEYTFEISLSFEKNNKIKSSSYFLSFIN